MDEYTLTLQIVVKIEAPDVSDALDVAMDTFGKGGAGSADVVEYEVLKIAESK
jgi:hypothetical protein